MRSDLIYDSLKPVTNRYLLCQLISKATRKFHRPNTRIQDTMNDVLARVGKARQPEVLADGLLMLMDGAYVAKRMYGSTNPAVHVAPVAAALVDAYFGPAT